MIECIRYKSVNKGTFIGFADFYLPKWDLTIYGCKHFMKDGRNWVKFPDKEATDKEGKKIYNPILSFRNKQNQEHFSDEAYKAILKKCESEAGEQYQADVW